MNIHKKSARNAEEETVAHLETLFMQREVEHRNPQDSFQLFQPIFKLSISQIQMRFISTVTI
jgi:hypothetical protein